MLEPSAIQQLSPAIDAFLNSNIGLLCLSEVRDSLLMWGHYTDNHQGFAIGFDSGHQFFSNRRSNADEFGFLRRVEYSVERPQVTLTDTTSPAWFSTKSEPWSYEKEWRIVRLLSEADHRIDRSPFPICLFGFPADAILEIVLGVRSQPALVAEIQSLAVNFPKAQLFAAREDFSYGLLIERIGP